jgi:Domain of unknown function (DUF4915)
MAKQSAPDSLMPDPTGQNGRDRCLSTQGGPAGPPEGPGPLRAVHTPNFPALLRQLGASLLITTYQAGKLVMLRDEGDHLNTHFRAFKAPMGLALADGGARLAIGTTIQVWEFRDVRDVARRLEPAGTHDACFLPRCGHITGNVLIRESALFSGIPITERLAPEERTCGVCVVDLRRGKPIALLKFESGVQEVFAWRCCRGVSPI